MPSGKRNKKKHRSRNKTASTKEHQGDKTLQDSDPAGLLFDQRNKNSPPASHGIDISTSLVRSVGEDSTLPGNSKIPCKNDSLRDHIDQEQRKIQRSAKNKSLDGLQQTCTKADDNFLFNSIQSTSQDRALELLKEHHTFSQDGLDRALILACQHGHKYLVQTLVSLGANVYLKDTEGNTPLLICAENGFTDIVRCLLSRKADVNAVNSAGNTALILSIRSSGSVETVKVILEQTGIKINHQNQDGYTALMKAVEVKDIDTMKLLLNESYNQSNSRPIDGRGYFVKQTTRERIVNNTLHKAELIAAKCGLGNVFRFLSKSRNTGNSSLVLAIEEGDTESFNILLNCQFLDKRDMERSIEEGFLKLFKNCEMKNGKTFNENEIAMIERLVECGANVSTRSYDGRPLSVAVETGNYRLVELLCKHGALVKHNWYGGESGPLQIAAKIGRCDLIELLSKYKGDINQTRFCGSALDCALSHGHIECAKRLIQLGATLDIKHALISAVDNQVPEYMSFLIDNYEEEVLNHLVEKTENQSNLLISGVKGGNLEIIGLILDIGADINRPTNDGVTPLVESKNGEVAQFLIQRGADVSQMKNNTIDGIITPVIHILMTRYDYDSPTLELVKVLLENGSSINGKDETNRTALMIAAEKEGSVDMLQILLDHGADPCDKDEDGNTTLLCSFTRRCFQNVSFLLQFSKNKDIINAQNHEGSTALMYAVSWGKLNIVTDLLKLGVDVNATDAKGNTALMRALMQSFKFEKDIVTTLIRAGSDVNYQNNEGLSPLMLTANKSMKDAMQFLLDSGADVNAASKTNHTRTALSCLFDNSFLREDTKCCIEYLLERGASASYVSPLGLVNVIFNGWIEVIRKIIQRGLGPTDIKSDDISHGFLERFLDFNVSPLCAALLVGNVGLARYFMGNLFLTNSDVSLLTRNIVLRCILERKNHQECLNFLDEMSSQPLSLLKLSLVAVSSGVGTSPGRENRVNMLPLPEIMKNKILFKTEEVSLTIPTANTRETFVLPTLNDLIYDLSLEDYFHVSSYVDSDDDSSTEYGWYSHGYYDYDSD